MKFLDLIKIDDEHSISGLTDELKSIYTYKLFLKYDSIIVVTNTLYEANIFYQRILNYTNEVLFFPMDDFLTSEALAISPELRTTRLETLNQLIKNSKKIVVTNLMGYLRYLPTPEIYKSKSIILSKNREYSIKQLAEDFNELGYTKETIVTTMGTFATRGFILDIFPLGENNPIRIEFFGDEIESIKVFNESTQITIDKIDSIEIKPNTEFLIKNNFEKKYREMPLYISTTNINSYLNNPKLIYFDYSQIQKGYEILLKDIENYNVTNNMDLNTKYMNPLDDIKVKDIYYLLNFDNKIDSVKGTQNYNSYEIMDFPISKEEINKTLKKYLDQNKTIIICISDRYKINKVLDILEIENVLTNENEIFTNKINIIQKNLLNGFQFENHVVLSETEIFNRKNINLKYNSNFRYGSKVRDINKLNIGDYIVHNAYGIGKYLGLKTLEKNGLKKDYIMLEYQDGDKLYIPVEKIELISKFSSNEGIIPKINKLGSQDWEKTKIRVKKKIENIAGDLLKLYAERESSVGFRFNKDDENQIEFEKQFPYEETKDQIKATEEIKKDMEDQKPMDRLLCGDVGFGKTEVAFRAIFKAILSGKQVAYLCPTTILSNQHYNNALERFKNFPVNIEVLNRFVNPNKTKEILENLKNGKIDLLIGTHRILSKDVEFKDLGLLVIDEEQRFGVKHKERIKSYKNNIDVLTLSATPIPRTLQMSMTGIRSLSLIETPPVDRYPIQTYVLEENNSIIKDAIYKELARNGQIFLLYNNVNDIENKKSELSRLIPEARIVFAHGRMTKTELENVMIKFINHEADVLLCTTIIETGIDIASANTLIIIDADKFGLSQLYQIRGRVGRSNKIAYCYLMYNKEKTLSDIATKRLNVIKEFTELGSGFSIAMRDLSIRGAGDILGSEQAGFIDSVGINLYLKMLDEEVNKLKGIVSVENTQNSNNALIEIETSISDEYVDDNDLKIEIHKKINEIDSLEKLNEIKKELEDRFGKINNSMEIYMYEELFEQKARSMNITNIKQTKNFIDITLPKEIEDKINVQDLFISVSKLTRSYRFSMKEGNLVITLDIVSLDKHFIYYLVDLLEILNNIIKK